MFSWMEILWLQGKAASQCICSIDWSWMLSEAVDSRLKLVFRNEGALHKSIVSNSAGSSVVRVVSCGCWLYMYLYLGTNYFSSPNFGWLSDIFFRVWSDEPVHISTTEQHMISVTRRWISQYNDQSLWMFTLLIIDSIIILMYVHIYIYIYIYIFYSQQWLFLFDIYIYIYM